MDYNILPEIKVIKVEQSINTYNYIEVQFYPETFLTHNFYTAQLCESKNGEFYVYRNVLCVGFPLANQGNDYSEQYKEIFNYMKSIISLEKLNNID